MTTIENCTRASGAPACRQGRRVRLHALASAVLAALVLPATPATADFRTHDRSLSAASVTTEAYDLGVRQFPQPLDGELTTMPIRLWGSVSVPAGTGPFPVVVIAHGAHGDNCPAGEFDGETWPCFDTERRSDLGLAHLGRAVAKAGAIAVVPDVNAAYTGGWGEGARLERLRFRQIVESTLTELAAAGAGTTSAFADLGLVGDVNVERLAVVGHSRGGYNAVAWTRRNASSTGSDFAASSLFLLAPFHQGKRVADIPMTVAVGTCDGDTGDSGLKYAESAKQDPDRTQGVVTLRVTGANHNNYNRTLVADRLDDADSSAPGCLPAQRPRPRAQQRWLRTVVVDHLRATFLQPRERAPYLKTANHRSLMIEGLKTRVERFRPS